MVLAEDDTDFTVLLGKQTGQFKNTLARHDNLVALDTFDAGIHGAHRQAMAVGGYGTQDAGVHFQQHAVEVVAHILLGHGEAGALDQAAQLALHQAEVQRTRAFLDRGEVVRRQGRQGETATAGLDQQLLLVDTDVDQSITGQALADIHQLACRYSDLTRLSRLFQGNAPDQLDLEVGTSQRQLLAFDYQQNVGEDRQGLAALDDAGDQLQGFQQGFALNCEMHGLVPCLMGCDQVVSVRSRFL
ncbi:hypothetical protein D3C85_581590 [compost metagenome]